MPIRSSSAPAARFAAADLGKAEERAFTARGRTFEQRLVAVLHSRPGSSSTVVAGAMLVPKLAVMAWYRVDLNGRRSLRRDKRISRMPCKSGSSDAQSEGSQCKRVTRAVSPLYRGVSLIHCEPCKPQEDTATATIRRFTAKPGCCCWLLFAVVPPPWEQKKRGFPRFIPAPSLFSRCISAKTAAASARRRLALTL